MRLLWASNSPQIGSGYGVQTKLVCRRLREAGHDVAINANYGHEQYFDEWDGFRVYPKGSDPHGLNLMPLHAQHWSADAMLTHYDSWVFDPREFHGKPWVPWFPVDTLDVGVPVLNVIQHAAYRMTQTRHAAESVQERGLQCAYVPAGYDSTIYRPRPEEAAQRREELGFADRYIVLVVAANKGRAGGPSRKAFPQMLEGFRWFLDHQPNAVLFLHTLMQGHLNLEQELARFKIPAESVVCQHPYEIACGLVTGEAMSVMMGAADVLLAPSMGEGFGVPIVEAQASGTPVITGDWTAMSEVARSGVKIPQSESIRWQEGEFGEWRMVRPEAVRDALIESVHWTRDAERTSQSVSEYEIDHVYAEHWTPALAELEAVLKPPQPNRAQRRRMKVEKPAAEAVA